MENSLKDIQEVKAITRKLLPLLDEEEQHFKSARNWGFVDLLGGGLLTDLIKHSKLNSASRVMNEINYLLRDLQRELKDIYIPTDYQMQLGGFSTFADFFFDGTLADAYMESKIISSLDQVRSLKQRIMMLDSRLNEMTR